MGMVLENNTEVRRVNTYEHVESGDRDGDDGDGDDGDSSDGDDGDSSDGDDENNEEW
jgi:hypothetical protein